MKFVMMAIKLLMMDAIDANTHVSQSVLTVYKESVQPVILLAGSSIIIHVGPHVVMG